MDLTLLFLLLFAVILDLHPAEARTFEKRNSSDLLVACNTIAQAISNASQVFYPPSPEYLSDIAHAASSSTQPSTCSVEPGSAEDVSKIIRVLGSSRIPFAVKGGGHIRNPGFSSTNGVEIAMTRFNQTKVDSSSGTVEVGPGLTWDQVYVALGPSGVNVLGGRVPGVGVAGLTLGGGYSFLSSQYGLSVDNIAGYELVLPNGTIVDVTSKDEDLYFGLRGGMNNFGIVTKFILKSHPQGAIWGGTLVYPESQLQAVKAALVKFQQQNDTKASPALEVTYSAGNLSIALPIFYDAPTPSEVFDDFLAIPTIGGSVNTTTYAELVLGFGAVAATNGLRGFTDAIPVHQYSPAVFDAIVNQIQYWGPRLYALDKNMSLGSTFEPFDYGVFSHGSDSAYPPDRSQALFPTALDAVWSNSSLDDTVASILRNFSETVHNVALADGQDVSNAAKYPNYALYGTPLENMYAGNLERLCKIRAAIDPQDVMGLTGGWKF
ncbi:FAD-binding domain-containing protein [Russula aff. rugulosa BPL654]|nr:FAD-binding domain-containing protein [Russula aff. rugulosa BPL654]